MTAGDLAAAERDQQVQVGQGNLVFIRPGMACGASGSALGRG